MAPHTRLPEAAHRPTLEEPMSLSQPPKGTLHCSPGSGIAEARHLAKRRLGSDLDHGNLHQNHNQPWMAGTTKHGRHCDSITHIKPLLPYLGFQPG